MILVTGGAGFIGGNFVLDWLDNPSAEGVINFDKLTYAGNLATLESLSSDSRHVRTILSVKLSLVNSGPQISPDLHSTVNIFKYFCPQLSCS